MTLLEADEDPFNILRSDSDVEELKIMTQAWDHWQCLWWSDKDIDTDWNWRDWYFILLPVNNKMWIVHLSFELFDYI